MLNEQKVTGVFSFAQAAAKAAKRPLKFKSLINDVINEGVLVNVRARGPAINLILSVKETEDVLLNIQIAEKGDIEGAAHNLVEFCKIMMVVFSDIKQQAEAQLVAIRGPEFPMGGEEEEAEDLFEEGESDPFEVETT